MDEYVKGLLKSLTRTRADVERAVSEYAAVINELVMELTKQERNPPAPTYRTEYMLGGTTESARGVVSEGATSGTACACGACVACGVKEWADEVHAKIVNAEKRVEGVGPHTSPRASGGCACQRNHCYGCDWGTSATHHATHATHVPATKGHDATSHG